MSNLNVDLQKSCEILGIEVEAYEEARQHDMSHKSWNTKYGD